MIQTVLNFRSVHTGDYAKSTAFSSEDIMTCRYTDLGFLGFSKAELLSLQLHDALSVV